MKESEKMKELINQIIQDLGANKPIDGILLKTQVVAHKLKNEEFLQWVKNEQNGYEDMRNVPDYRKIGCTVKALISIPFRGMINMTIPILPTGNDKIDSWFQHKCIVNSLYEIENMCRGHETEELSSPLPAFLYAKLKESLYQGTIENASVHFSASATLGIINIFKSKLLDFFLRLDDEINEGLDFSQLTDVQRKVTQIMNNTYNINAAVANTGSGAVTATNINASNFSIVSEEQKNKINELVAELEQKSQKYNNEDLKSAIDSVKNEIAKPSWDKRLLRMAFNAINGIATGIAANQLSPIVMQALSAL